MKKCCVILIALALVAMCVPSMAAKVMAVPIVHPPYQVFQAYPGNSLGTNLAFMGYLGFDGDVISSVPGILSIIPGSNWSNYVGAAQAGVPYTIKNVVLRKQTPEIIQCRDIFPPKVVTQ